MDEWVTIREASEVKKVGLSRHRIAELARMGDIIAVRAGIKSWKVKVTYKDNQWGLVGVDENQRKQMVRFSE